VGWGVGWGGVFVGGGGVGHGGVCAGGGVRVGFRFTDPATPTAGKHTPLVDGGPFPCSPLPPDGTSTSRSGPVTIAKESTGLDGTAFV